MKPEKFSGLVAVQLIEEKVPLNWIVPWPSLPVSALPMPLVRVPGPKKPVPWLRIVKGRSNVQTVGAPTAPKLMIAILGLVSGELKVMV